MGVDAQGDLVEFEVLRGEYAVGSLLHEWVSPRVSDTAARGLRPLTVYIRRGASARVGCAGHSRRILTKGRIPAPARTVPPMHGRAPSLPAVAQGDDVAAGRYLETRGSVLLARRAPRGRSVHYECGSRSALSSSPASSVPDVLFE